MSECYRYLFIKNEQLKPCEEFTDLQVQNGISLYEVLRVVSGKPIFLQEHFTRLCNSALHINQLLWYNFEDISRFIHLLIEKNDVNEGNIKLVFNIQKNHKNFFAYFLAHKYPNKIQYTNGVRTMIHSAERPTPKAKVYHHQLRSKTNNIIREAEIFEVLLLNKAGNLTEGSRSNLFFIKNNELYTAPDNEVLNGIARSKVLEIADKLNITVHKTSIAYEDIRYFDAAFLTGTSPMVLPIQRINSLRYSVTHPLLSDILRTYRSLIKEYLNQ
ncbi:aminotransferase class IV [Ancylomarina longa]|uniref:branched-chain-amino-acid transaminase n=1 Tax=Ancylomarina longa TaxID=2487017 RepID=A0A434AUW0_9BACT|nr:aminotransferase class IV [Ancylomarina longa]RUT78258.1 aminotransferase class IV [Ancylomarina longa]